MRDGEGRHAPPAAAGLAIGDGERRARHRKAEAHVGALRRVDGQRDAEQVDEPAHDGEAKLVRPRAVAVRRDRAVELVEDPAKMLRRDAVAVVADLDHDRVAGNDAGDADLAARRELQRVAEEVAQHLAEQHRIGPRADARRVDMQRHLAVARERRELAAEPGEELGEVDVPRARLDHARVEPADVEQRVDEAAHLLDRARLLRDDLAQLRRACLVVERAVQEAQGLQRLAQVVAGGGDEAPRRFARGRGGRRGGRVPRGLARLLVGRGRLAHRDRPATGRRRKSGSGTTAATVANIGDAPFPAPVRVGNQDHPPPPRISAWGRCSAIYARAAFTPL